MTYRQAGEHAIETGTVDEAIQQHMAIVEDYNREDCESAKRLRDWLEELRAEVARLQDVLATEYEGGI